MYKHLDVYVYSHVYVYIDIHIQINTMSVYMCVHAYTLDWKSANLLLGQNRRLRNLARQPRQQDTLSVPQTNPTGHNVI